jgi:hypothetical protein
VKGTPAKIEALYTERTPLGATATLKCVRCGGEAEPGSEKYREILCNKCAIELGKQEATR